MPRRIRSHWHGALSVGISVALLAWALHEIRLADVVRHLTGVRVVPLIVTIVIAMLTYPLFAIRWRYLLGLDSRPLPLIPVWHATAIGFMTNNVLPARAGEFARVYAARRLIGVRISTAAGTLAVSKLMDGISLTALLAIAIVIPHSGLAADPRFQGITFGQIVTSAVILLSAILAAVVAAVRHPEPALYLTRSVANTLLPASWAGRVTNSMGGLLEGLAVCRTWRRLAILVGSSMLIWGFHAVSYWACFLAFDLVIPWTAALVLQSLIAFGTSIPSSPGFFGPFEAVARVTLVAYGVEPGAAISFAVGYHLGAFIPITLLGLWSLTRVHLHLTDAVVADRREGRGGSPAHDGFPVGGAGSQTE